MKYLFLAAALTALSTATPLPAPAMPSGLPTESNSLTICRDGWSRCEVQFHFVSAPQPSTRKIGCLNIDNTQKKMGIHPSADLKCALYFWDNCRSGTERRCRGNGCMSTRASRRRGSIPLTRSGGRRMGLVVMGPMASRRRACCAGLRVALLALEETIDDGGEGGGRQVGIKQGSLLYDSVSCLIIFVWAKMTPRPLFC